MAIFLHFHNRSEQRMNGFPMYVIREIIEVSPELGVLINREGIHNNTIEFPVRVIIVEFAEGRVGH